MAEIVGAFGGGGGNRTHSEALIPEQDQGPASAEAGTEAVPNRLEALLWHLEHGKHMPRHWKLELAGLVRGVQTSGDLAQHVVEWIELLRKFGRDRDLPGMESLERKARMALGEPQP